MQSEVFDLSMKGRKIVVNDNVGEIVGGNGSLIIYRFKGGYAQANLKFDDVEFLD